MPTNRPPREIPVNRKKGNELSTEQRAAIYGRSKAGISKAEIARQTGITRQTISSTLSRILRRQNLLLCLEVDVHVLSRLPSLESYFAIYERTPLRHITN